MNGFGYRTLTQEDVGRYALPMFGCVWPVVNFMGRILPQDVGKRIVLVGGIIQVESDEQRKKRENT